MLIGDLAHAAGLQAQTIRFYEREGLLPRPSREANGYRRYDETTLNRLGFIRTAQSAGLTLAQIRSIVDVRDAGDPPCQHVTALLVAKLDAVRARQKELETLASEIERLLERTATLDPKDCSATDVCTILV